MKPANFPARKLSRQFKAQQRVTMTNHAEYHSQLETARAIRTKKRRTQ